MPRVRGQQATHHDQKKIHVLVSFMHLVQHNVGVVGQRLVVNQIVQQHPGGAVQQTSVLQRVRAVQAHLEAAHRVLLPLALLANSIRYGDGSYAPGLCHHNVAVFTAFIGLIQNVLGHL